MICIPNTNFKIKWSDILSNTVDLNYSIDGGNNWILIGNVPNNNGPELGQGYYNWLVPNDLENNTIVLLSVYDHDTIDMGFIQEVTVVIFNNNNLLMSFNLGENMAIVSTLDGEQVTILNINNDGHVIYVTYLDSDGNIKVTKKFMDLSQGDLVIAQDAVIS